MPETIVLEVGNEDLYQALLLEVDAFPRGDKVTTKQRATGLLLTFSTRPGSMGVEQPRKLELRVGLVRGVPDKVLSCVFQRSDGTTVDLREYFKPGEFSLNRTLLAMATKWLESSA